MLSPLKKFGFSLDVAFGHNEISLDLQDLGLFATLAIRSGLELPKLRYEQKLLIRWLLIGQTSFTMLEEARVEIAQTTFV